MHRLRLDHEDWVALRRPLLAGGEDPSVLVLKSRAEALRPLDTLRAALAVAAAFDLMPPPDFLPFFNRRTMALGSVLAAGWWLGQLQGGGMSERSATRPGLERQAADLRRRSLPICVWEHWDRIPGVQSGSRLPR